MVVFEEDTGFKDVYGGALGMVAGSHAHYPRDKSDTAIVFPIPSAAARFCLWSMRWRIAAIM